MKALSEIWHFLLAVYLIIVSLLLLTLVFPFYLIFIGIFSKSGPSMAHRYLSSNWSRTFFTLTFLRVKITGKEKIRKDQTYVFVCNHRTPLDIPISTVSNNHFFKFLSKEELTKVPMLGWIIKKLYITVDRKTAAGRQRSMVKMKEELKRGTSVFIFPEGTRNKGPQLLGKFYDGAFRAAIDAQVPLAVLTIIGAADVLPPKHLNRFYPGKIKAHWSEPIETTGMTVDDVPRLKEMAQQQMMEWLLKYYPKGKY